MEINLIHKKQTEKEAFENVKKLHKLYPGVIMNPEEWKRLRQIELEKEWKS